MSMDRKDYITEVKSYVCRCCNMIFPTIGLAEAHVRNCIRIDNVRGRCYRRKLTSDELWERAGRDGPISREELGIYTRNKT